MTGKKAFILVAVTATILAFAGILLGVVIGLLVPDYYYSLFLTPPDSSVSAVWLGAQLGMQQGFVLGLIVGLLVVVPIARHRSRTPKSPPEVRQRRSSKTQIVLACLLLAIFVGVPIALFSLYFLASVGSNRGSVKLATVWRDTLQKYKTPDEAKGHVRNLEVAHFKNGEWAFGLSQNSHGAWLRGGGTVVVKDSRGNIRVFFGHVCGSGCLNSPSWNPLPDLDALYAKLKDRDFVEQQLP